MGFSYFSYDQEYADKISQGKQIIPSITLFHVFNYDAFYDVYTADHHGSEEACETVVSNSNAFNYDDSFYDDVYEPLKIDWTHFNEFVAGLCEELKLQILEKRLKKDGGAVVHHDDGVDEVEGEVILWRPAGGVKY
ncbi:hypothetical protein NC652_023680 [Populus alba x Populus x berolinensis]|uniref:Uncharacterized protein n=3 Tax=Populus TaxID=3689 RepID=A0ACC4BQ64_POPAL|nr:hypothetical protein NC652_023680 [Populus alba x Populus x berolinensis]KAJ6985401.1 hypothetical protein NC653_023380 [Populus alba x Populus x berolinensis]TKS05278.1 hypothetical protein D5086_0000133750 [Populus alba]